MNIQQANPNIKTFLFFLLVLISGLFSMILALYFEKVFPGIKSDQELPVNSHPSEALKAGFFTDYSANSKNNTPTASLSGSLTPPSEATIILQPLDKGKKTFHSVGMSGAILIRNIKRGDYELIIIPTHRSGLPEKRIDLINIHPGLNTMGVLELD